MKMLIYQCDSAICKGMIFMASETLLSCPYCDASMIDNEPISEIELNIEIEMEEEKMNGIIRTTEEIKQKMEEGFETDFFGFGLVDIANALPFEEVKEFLKDEFLAKPNAKELYEKEMFKTREDVIRTMKDYLPFAWEKANNGRGLSADRSIQHYIAWSWLIDDDLHNELVRMYKEEYRDYGKNILEYIESWLNNQ